MTPDQVREPYIMFDLNGQNVGVLEAGIDDTGELRCTWVCIDKVRKFTNEQIEDMLHNAFKDLIERQLAADEQNDN